ncbi:MAG TPA: SRPBCC family protein [Candidatus Kapabacteria bacterium]|jgi:hypothetical protein|nr:SRPBCC family protein [Candidatus Kapabacteria bacterium]
MKYTYEYPRRVRAIHGRSDGTFSVNEDHVAQTHGELLDHLDSPRGGVTVQATVDATPRRVWSVVGSPARLFSHQPRFAGLSTLAGYFGASEGGRYVIHRAHEGVVFDRFGEVLLCMEGSQLSVSDLDIVDPSVSGHFPSLFTVRLEEDPEDSDRCIVQLTYTTIGVVPQLMPAVLLLQLRSIQERAEEASLSER